jgi:hypothetical protein
MRLDMEKAAALVAFELSRIEAMAALLVALPRARVATAMAARAPAQMA